MSGRWRSARSTAPSFAHELRALGYAIEADGKNNFRLTEVPQEIERHFSKRRIQIEAALAERGAAGAKAAEWAALDTRKQKDAAGAATLRAGWREQAHALGLTAQHLAELPGERVTERHAIGTAAVIEGLHAQHSTFTAADIVRAVAEATQTAGGGLARIEEMTRTVATDPEVVKLAEDRYTTRAMLEVERGALVRADQLAKDVAYAVDPNALAAAEKSRPLSEEQRAALHHLTRASRLTVLEGLAGTGKSHLLGAAREAWEASGYEPRGAALAGKAAKGLAEDSGLRAQTLHSLLADLKRGRDRLTARTVLVIDEAGMVGSRQLARVLEEVDKAHAKLVLVGDANQLQPIEAGQLFERVGDEVGAARLTEIRRQREESERSMVRALASGDTRAALTWLQEHGRVHAAPDREQAMHELVRDWSRGRDVQQPREDLMLSATRADTLALNHLAREHLHRNGELRGEHVVETANGPLGLAQGDRIVITRNTKMLGMMNGDLATVTALTERRGELQITARLDSGSTRTWRVGEHPHIEHGYALTAHKAQGVSVERAYVLAHESLSAREWSYVAGSRARDTVHLYAERHTADDLERIMGRSHKKDTALSYEPVSAVPTSTPAATKTPPVLGLER